MQARIVAQRRGRRWVYGVVAHKNFVTVVALGIRLRRIPGRRRCSSCRGGSWYIYSSRIEGGPGISALSRWGRLKNHRVGLVCILRLPGDLLPPAQAHLGIREIHLTSCCGCLVDANGQGSRNGRRRKLVRKNCKPYDRGPNYCANNSGHYKVSHFDLQSEEAES